LCEKCDVEIARTAWDTYLKSERHLTDKPDKYRKVCEKCNLEMSYAVWVNHLRSKNYLKNDPEQTTKPQSKPGRPKAEN
jgi:hypothetical protein